MVLTMIHPELLSRLCRARDLLRDWEDEPLSITAIARASGLTPFHFIRLFKTIFGETRTSIARGRRSRKRSICLF